MIKLTDFITTPDILRTKIKFNMNASDRNKQALDLLLEDNEEWLIMNSWKTKQSNNNLNRADYLISFAQYYPYGPEYFILGGIYKVEKVMPEVFKSVGCNLTLMPDYKDYIKRLIIKINKSIGRDSYNKKFETVQQQLNPEVYELASNDRLEHFLGY